MNDVVDDSLRLPGKGGAPTPRALARALRGAGWSLYRLAATSDASSSSPRRSPTLSQAWRPLLAFQMRDDHCHGRSPCAAIHILLLVPGRPGELPDGLGLGACPHFSPRRLPSYPVLRLSKESLVVTVPRCRSTRGSSETSHPVRPTGSAPSTPKRGARRPGLDRSLESSRSGGTSGRLLRPTSSFFKDEHPCLVRLRPHRYLRGRRRDASRRLSDGDGLGDMAQACSTLAQPRCRASDTASPSWLERLSAKSFSHPTRSSPLPPALA